MIYDYEASGECGPAHVEKCRVHTCWVKLTQHQWVSFQTNSCAEHRDLKVSERFTSSEEK